MRLRSVILNAARSLFGLGQQLRGLFVGQRDISSKIVEFQRHLVQHCISKQDAKTQSLLTSVEKKSPLVQVAVVIASQFIGGGRFGLAR